MKIHWEIEPADVQKVTELYEREKDNAFVQRRVRTNLRETKEPITKALFWERMIGCLLTSQQLASPTSPVTRFLLTQPFLLPFEACQTQPQVDEFVTTTLKTFGGIRFVINIGKYAKANLRYLEEGGWSPTLEVLEGIRLNSTPDTERHAARFIAQHFEGFGPKQSRNLIQGLGLSRFEVPIDSRVIAWLNTLPFAIRLSAMSLGDHDYYEFLSIGFQRLAEAVGVYPCILDAVVFSAVDKGKWTEENAVW